MRMILGNIFLTLKTKGRQIDNIVVTGGTVSCQNDNLRSQQWRQCCQLDDLFCFQCYVTKPLTRSGSMAIVINWRRDDCRCSGAKWASCHHQPLNWHSHYYCASMRMELISINKLRPTEVGDRQPVIFFGVDWFVLSELHRVMIHSRTK